MYYQSTGSNDLSKYGLGSGAGGMNSYTTTTTTTNKPPTYGAPAASSSSWGNSNVLANPMATSVGGYNQGTTGAGVNRGDTQSSQYGFRDNDYRTNFNISNLNNQKSSFRDTLGGGFGSGGNNAYNTTSGFPTSSTKLDYQYGGPTNTNLAGQYGNYGTASKLPAANNYPASSGQPNKFSFQPYTQQGVAPTTQMLDPKVKVSDQYQMPPQQKPKPLIDNSQTKQIADIMNNNKDVDKTKMMDLGNLGKVVYSAALSASSSSQKYEQTLAELKRSNQQFSDSDFPADKSSLAPPEDQSSYRDVVAWKRAKDIFKNPQLFEGAVEPGDIMQGNLGDCYLLSTLAAIAENPDRIKRIFLSTETSQNGIYAVELVWRGVNTQVILDDFIAVDKKNEPYFLKAKNNELWVGLLEKAWAKLHRNYHRLDGQLTKETLHDFTGAPVRSYRTNKDQDALWQKMCAADKANQIMTTGTEGEDVGASGDPLRKFGLVSGHAYTLIGASDVKMNNGQTVRLVKVRNPWGEFEWSGKWADKDSLWNQVSQQEKSRIGFSVEDDGTFFLEYSNMLEYFDGVQICYYNNDFLYTGKQFRSSYQESKYFEVKIAKEGNYFWNVSQLSIRTFDEDYQENPNSHYSDTKFCIMNSGGQVIQAFSAKKRDLYSCKYIDAPKPFAAGTYYAFVRIQWQKNATHNFGLGAYGPGKIEITEVQKGQAGKLGDQVSAWEQNRYPQFEIEQVGLI